MLALHPDEARIDAGRRFPNSARVVGVRDDAAHRTRRRIVVELAFAQRIRLD
jgi:hypothetical protein